MLHQCPTNDGRLKLGNGKQKKYISNFCLHLHFSQRKNAGLVPPWKASTDVVQTTKKQRRDWENTGKIIRGGYAVRREVVTFPSYREKGISGVRMKPLQIFLTIFPRKVSPESK